MTKTNRWGVGLALMVALAGTIGGGLTRPARAQVVEPECVAVVGESVAYGSLVFEVPRFGFLWPAPVR